jgi:hypothetical protein
MRVEKPTAMQIIVAWRVNKWVVEQDATEVGTYAYRTHAMERARTLATHAQASGEDCYLLIKEQDGRWVERPCPKPTARRAQEDAE